MKKILLLATFIFILLTLYFYEKNIEFLGLPKEKEIQVLIKNISSNSKISSNTPYSKGDNLEYGIIVKPLENNKITIKIDKISNIIDITEIKVDGETINKEEINNKTFSENSVITISGIAKNDSDLIKQDDDIITFNTEEDVITELNNENDIIIDENIKEDDIKIDTIYKEIKGINIEKLNYSSNIDNIIKISGENLDQIEYVNIGEMSFKPQLNKDYIYILVEKNDILNGEQFVFFQKLNGDIEVYNKKVNFTYSASSIIVIDITPKIIKNDMNRNIILQGKGFSKVISIGLSNNIILKDTSFNIINNEVMSVTIPKDFPKGTYNLNIMNVEGIYKSTINIIVN